MASFTDRQPLQFNPYIQQIPVDDYTRVGIMRQQRYDEGVQRVQQMVDTVEGLPVVGEANKQLLASKIGELRTQIQGVLKADFGKMNLQMQIGNLASQVAKDPAIMNSIETARKFQQAEASVAEAGKSGKGYSAANEYYLRAAMQDYLKASEKEAGLSYNGPTSIHNVTEDDVLKKIKDVVAQFKGMEDIDYTITSNGKVMLKNEDKILDATRIKAAIEGALTADDLKALSIAGWYNTANLSDQELVNRAGKMYVDVANRANQMADYYDNMALATPDMTEEDKRRYQNIADQHRYYAKQYKDLSDATKEKLNNGTFNREDVAGTFWKEQIENNYAGAYQFRQQKKDRELDPAFDVWYKEQDILIKQLKEQRELEENKDNPENDLIDVVNVNPNTYSQKYSSKSVQQDIDNRTEDLNSGSAQDRAAMAYAKSLYNSSDPDAKALSGITEDVASPTGFRWNSKAEKDKLIQMMNEGQVSYHKAAMSPNFNGVIPYSSKEARAAHNNNLISANALSLIKQSDNSFGESAAAKTPGLRSAEKDKNRVVKIRTNDGNTEDLTVGRIINLISRQPNITNHAASFAPFGTSALQERASPGSTVQATPDQKQAQRELAKYDRNDINKIASQYGLNIEKLNEAKDKIYKDKTQVISPRIRYFGASDKRKHQDEIDAYRKWVTGTDLFKGGMRDTMEREISNKSMPESKDIEIAGAYRDIDNRLKMRVQWYDKELKTTREADVNVPEETVAKANPKSWLGSRFLPDNYSDLSEALRRPGSGASTLFSEKTNFRGALQITGNDRVARKYGISYDRSTDMYHVTVAIPIGNGRFTKLKLPQAFPHAGAAIEEIETIYSTVSDTNPISKLEEGLLQLVK